MSGPLLQPGEIVARSLRSKLKSDRRTDLLLFVGYLLSRLPEEENTLLLGDPKSHALLLLRSEGKAEDGTSWKTYSVQVGNEGQVDMPFVATYYGNSREIAFSYNPGPWETELEKAYNDVRQNGGASCTESK